MKHSSRQEMTQKLIQISGLNKALCQLAIQNSMPWCGHVLRMEDGYVLRMESLIGVGSKRRKEKLKRTRRREMD